MLKYLILIPPHFGHINPTLGIGAELLRRGHQVIWVGFQEVKQDIFPEGGEFIVPEEFSKHKDEIQKIINRQDEATKNTANQMIEWAFESTWFPFCHIVMKGFRQVIRRLQPDLIIHDEGLSGGAICAVLENIPYVTSISSHAGLYYPANVLSSKDQEWVATKMRNIQEHYGILQEELVFNSPHLNLVYTSREFVSADIFPEKYHFVGPIVEGRPSTVPFEWKKLPENNTPIVYVSTGSLLKEIKKVFFAKVIEAFKEENITIVAPVDPDTFNEWPANFIVQTSLPQLELMQKVDAVVSAGGFNTINEAIYFGKPMLIIPLANDQFGNAHLVANTGCGLKLRFRRLTVEDLRECVFKLLNYPSYKENAELFGRTLSNGGGAKRAATLIENVPVNCI